MKIEGGCYCGEIKYEADVDPKRVGVCNCADCQAMTGSLMRVNVYVKRALTSNKRDELAPKEQYWVRSRPHWFADLDSALARRSLINQRPAGVSQLADVRDQSTGDNG